MMMSKYALRQHLTRAWGRHWPLQVASVTVMTVVLLLMNFMFLSLSGFNELVSQWGRGLEMIVYLKESTNDAHLKQLREQVETSGEFDQVAFISKSDATKKFLTALGGESLSLMSDPKWNSPIPASFELRLSDKIPLDARVNSLKSWATQFHALGFVEDVFYGQGWVENFSRFMSSARGVVLAIWILSLSIGLLIVSNCIQLSFMQRKDEIEVLELVGATTRFIRTPFLIEGVTIGLLASLASLILSFLIHAAFLNWLGSRLDFWIAVHQVRPMQLWYVVANIATGLVFGLLGSWNCVRKLNTGWAAVE